MSIKFEDLPKHEKVYILLKLGLPEREEKMLYLRYVEGFSYSMIASEMNLSPKSVGTILTRIRKHAAKIAAECYELADERCKAIIRKVDWSDEYNPNRVSSGMTRNTCL